MPSVGLLNARANSKSDIRRVYDSWPYRSGVMKQRMFSGWISPYHCGVALPPVLEYPWMKDKALARLWHWSQSQLGVLQGGSWTLPVPPDVLGCFPGVVILAVPREHAFRR